MYSDTLSVGHCVINFQLSAHLRLDNARPLQSTEQLIFYLNTVNYIQIKVFLSFVFFINIRSQDRPVNQWEFKHQGLMNFVSYVNTHFIRKVSPRYDKILEPFGATQELTRPLCWDSPRAKPKPMTTSAIISTAVFEVIAPSFGHFFETLLEMLWCSCSPVPTEMDC